MYDLCIIGGGAAGMSCAITAAKRGLKVILCDRNNKIGKKLYATGNGKCNITNRNMDIPSKYNSSGDRYVDFLNDCMGEHPSESVTEFCNSLGVLTYSADDYVYPSSEQASAVVWAMLDEMKKNGVKALSKCEITHIDINDGYFVINALNEQIRASQVVLACGSMSYPALGGTKLGYELAKEAGHTIKEVRAALCGLNTEDNLSDIAGVRTRACAYLVSGGKRVSETEYGELQLTQYGVSGIMIFNLSSIAGFCIRDGKRTELCINLLPELTREKLDMMYEVSGERTVVGFLNGFLNDRLAKYFVKRHGINGQDKLSSADRYELDRLIDELFEFKLNITGIRDYDSAQVCAGGVDISEIDPHTMMSRLVEGLYIVGELADIDGICGGYNLTFAILSGIRAGISASDKCIIYRDGNSL